MNKFEMIFRNTLNAIVAIIAAVGSGLTALLGYIEPIIGSLAAIMGFLAAYATWKAQRKKERLTQIEIDKHTNEA